MSRTIGIVGRLDAPRRARGAVLRRAALAALLLAPAVAATLGGVAAAPEDEAVGKAAVRDFSNPAAITINDAGRATPYPSAIPVSGMVGGVVDLDVTLSGLYHTNPDDIDVLVVSPNGRAVIVMSDVGGGENALNTTITFDDEAAGFLLDNGPLRSGAARPTNVEGPDTFANPAPAPSGPALTEFDGIDPNGTWLLFVTDDTGDNTGSFAGGWSLRVTTVNRRPVAKNDRFVAEEGERLTVRTPGLLKNDTDADGDRLRAKLVRQGTKGVARVLPNGGFTYTPKRNRTGPDTFAYQVTDSSNTVSTATVTIIIKPERRGDDD
jgi:subtilisin-like proprotein convertase family protein